MSNGDPKHKQWKGEDPLLLFIIVRWIKHAHHTELETKAVGIISNVTCVWTTHR